jgi:hypothetical protein
VSVQVHSISQNSPFKALAKEPEIQDFKASQGWIERLFARKTLCIKAKNKSLSHWQDVKSGKAKGCITNKLRTSHSNFKTFVC